MRETWTLESAQCGLEIIFIKSGFPLVLISESNQRAIHEIVTSTDNVLWLVNALGPRSQVLSPI